MIHKKHRVLIADDHLVITKGLKLLLKNDFGITNIYECQEFHLIMSNIRSNQISHLILDVSFPEDSSINIIESIKLNFPELAIMLFTMHPVHLFQNILVQFPEIFFSQKSESEQRLFRTLNSFLNNSNKSKEIINHNKKWKLSKNEEIVTRLLIEGKTTGQIAEHLKLKSNTISTYKKRIFEKTDAQNILELAKIFQ
jgi:DNA-binding NarL/FixJ family response regulator